MSICYISLDCLILLKASTLSTLIHSSYVLTNPLRSCIITLLKCKYSKIILSIHVFNLTRYNENAGAITFLKLIDVNALRSAFIIDLKLVIFVQASDRVSSLDVFRQVMNSKLSISKQYKVRDFRLGNQHDRMVFAIIEFRLKLCVIFDSCVFHLFLSALNSCARFNPS